MKIHFYVNFCDLSDFQKDKAVRVFLTRGDGRDPEINDPVEISAEVDEIRLFRKGSDYDFMYVERKKY